MLDGQIKVSGLTKVYRNLRAVDDLSFTVEPGRVTGFLGPNGAGKTTTLRMLLNLVRPTAGMATMDELALSDAMLGSWSRFAKSGDPNDAAAPWPKYDAATDTSIAFGAPVSSVTGLKKEKCDFWDAL